MVRIKSTENDFENSSKIWRSGGIFLYHAAMFKYRQTQVIIIRQTTRCMSMNVANYVPNGSIIYRELFDMYIGRPHCWQKGCIWQEKCECQHIETETKEPLRFSNNFFLTVFAFKISLQFDPNRSVNTPALVQDWPQKATKHNWNQWWPSLPTPICITRHRVCYTSQYMIYSLITMTQVRIPRAR